LEDTGLIELGYRFVRPAWGQGVATEAGRSVLAYGFGRLGIDPIVAVTHPENRASQQVLRKLGFRFTETAFHYGGVAKTYELDRASFETALRGEQR
jgi:RimJ/RimL family protein N-acetyltransferase